MRHDLRGRLLAARSYAAHNETLLAFFGSRGSRVSGLIGVISSLIASHCGPFK